MLSFVRFRFSFLPALCHNSFYATSTEFRDIQKHVLPNGLVVITETMTHVRSVSVGMWIRNGSRREVPEENGLAHFMEHMVFKGTERRSAEAIAREMDSVGGMLDAFTSKEQICFNAKVLDEHLPIAFDVIADLVFRPKFDSEDVKKERQVVLEEIKMDLDNPEYMLHEIFTRGFWPEHALGRPILGTPDTVRNSIVKARSRFQHGLRRIISSSPPRATSRTKKCWSWCSMNSAIASRRAR